MEEGAEISHDFPELLLEAEPEPEGAGAGVVSAAFTLAYSSLRRESG